MSSSSSSNSNSSKFVYYITVKFIILFEALEHHVALIELVHKEKSNFKLLLMLFNFLRNKLDVLGGEGKF
ncbi:hypothetical protein T05_11262 [Trichinella murrelli]|uniref:Uncharacterized protein n=1 Tax=Trichinella murrelli TaxID=144512 RepID=A0A0V0U3B4_9BILA|nr:hypothetical protein T05_11262 [Trichinella murrelli]